MGGTGREGVEQSVSFVLSTDSLSTARTFIQQVEIGIFFSLWGRVVGIEGVCMTAAYLEEGL